MIGFFGTVQQKWRFELQKPIKPCGFIGFSRRQINFISTVQQKSSFAWKTYQKPQVFIGFGKSKLHFAVLHCSEGRSLTNPWWKGQITYWSYSEALSLRSPLWKGQDYRLDTHCMKCDFWNLEIWRSLGQTYSPVPNNNDIAFEQLGKQTLAYSMANVVCNTIK